ncbi:Asp-tRNA(Asn)/Glu-tRNA(Gln) amidotransferase subunit GatA [Hydrogenibacillus schlegelii]|uniref:Glutamyl-tRNA(Gln) amidotransferase subunit A n=2 Tax=Hydrogenibacillus schlegelii TaxID=1484 RepID=A0A132NBT4_HYDSH|nr:Asp-tRNA(Asn)/Glu-tRNA(Gln) amidotransferase subunit GatA [Hydrogenibacillus schlegelii]KWX07605.1 glutamyl-tRNA amidotransferase [Hydrogenibacillus schlegelii]OAR03429.1 glutamyl-tRNA amidotransferase [Hydrogenibacillus schlegelii]
MAAYGDLLEERIPDLRRRLETGELAPEALLEAALERIAAVEDRIESFIALDPDAARRRAAALSEKRRRGEALGALYGIPAAVKDNIAVAGLPMTAGSRMLEGFLPPDDAVVTERLLAADAVIVGKANLDEFAMGGSTETSAYRTTKNPWHPDRVPGGSSGGSAAAVAAREVWYAIGTDSGGSIRQPASFTGIVGFKPTYGRIPRTGVVAFASSFDTVGVLARTVEEAAIVYDALHGFHPSDTTSLPRDREPVAPTLGRDVRGLKVAVPTFWLVGLHPDVRARTEEALRVLEGLGAIVEPVDMPHLAYAEAAYTILTMGEAASNLARFDGLRYGRRFSDARDLAALYAETRARGFGREVKRRVLLGTYFLSAGRYEDMYVRAQKVRTLIRRDFERVFADYDLVAGPTVPTPAFPLSERLSDPVAMYQSDRLTSPANLAGLPAVSVPAGFSAEGLPIGLQLVGDVAEDALVLQAAYAYQAATEHHRRRPAL